MQDGIRPVAVSLALFSAVLGVVGAVVVGLLLRRHVEVTLDDRAALAGMGFTRRQHGAVALLRGATVGTAAAALAVALAVIASPRFPMGPARLAEPAPGVSADVVVLVLGAVVVILVGGGATLGAHLPSRPSSAAPMLRFVLSPSATAGIRAALGPNQRASRMAIASGAVGVAAIVAVAEFGTDLDRLVSEPTRYGQQWERVLDAEFGAVPTAAIVDRYTDDDRVVALVGGTYGELVIDGVAVPSVGWLDLHGSTGPTVVDGRLAQQPGELALGGDVLDRLDLAVGDRVIGDPGGGPKESESGRRDRGPPVQPGLVHHHRPW